MDAKIEWARITNPFGSGRSAEKPKPTTVAEKLRQALTGRKAAQSIREPLLGAPHG
jgi:hypothetical protein